jgi:GMP synthase PP-ATPase subunit
LPFPLKALSVLVAGNLLPQKLQTTKEYESILIETLQENIMEL